MPFYDATSNSDKIFPPKKIYWLSFSYAVYDEDMRILTRSCPTKCLTLSGLENSTRPLVFTSVSGCRASEYFDISTEN